MINNGALHRAACTLALWLGMSVLAIAQLARQDHGGPGHTHHGHDGHDHQHEDIRALLNMHDHEIFFTENKGQFGDGVLFRADFPLGQAVATAEGMVVTAFDPVEVEKRVAEGFRIEDDILRGLPHRELTWQRKGHAWQLHFLGASPTMQLEGQEAHADRSHYFLGDDPRSHATDVHSFQEVWYRDVYPNVDVRYYPAEDGSLEYDILCMPGSDPTQVAIEFRGIDRLWVNAGGELVMNTSLGEMSYPAPYVYQRVGGKELQVPAHFVTDGNVLRFELGEYDRNAPLVIDPIAMRWATWVNTNSSGDNHGHCIWVDPSDGAIYLVARVVGTTDQITPGAFNVTANGNLDIIIGKYLEPANVGESGTRVWQTYLGGSGDDNPYAMEQGPDGHLYITGNTTSTNYPLLGGPLFGGSSINQQAQTGADIFLTKIDRDGTSIKSAVVGGNGADLSFDLRIAANGEVVVCGYTTSSNLATVNPGVGATNSNAGGRDVIVYKINQDLSTLNWLRNYGGGANDQAMIMLQANNGDIFIGGLTLSTNFPLTNPRQNTRGGSQAGFLQRLNSAGTTLWSSYFSSASSQTASILCMEFNTTQSELYFGGVTSGLPASNIGPVGVFDNTHNGSNDFFVCRMDTDQNFIASTYIGGSGNEVNMMGLNVDLNNDVYVFGYSNSTNFPVSAAPNVPLQTTKMGTGSNNDKVFFKLESDLSDLEFSTYYGGSADDYDPVGERGIKFSNCRIYTIVTARSNNIPLTQGALNTTKNSPTTRYEPGLVIWANPPDLLGNTITGNQSVCEGSVPGDIIGSEPSYVLPTVVRNNVASGYPSLGSAATYQWQISTDSLIWIDIPGATGQNLPGAFIGPVDQKTFIRRIIGGDACILAGAADQVVTVKIIEVTADVEHVSCNGANDGAITATSDGVGPFQYEWSHGPDSETVTDLTPGFYTVTVTDINGCTAEGTFEVTQPPVLTAQAQVTDATCNTSNGSATVTPNGGTPGYQFNWDTGAVGATLSGVPGGNYEVTVMDANGCTFVLPVQVGSTGVPDVSAGPAAVIDCTSGPEIQLQGSSATPGATFGWVASNGGNIVSGADQPDPTVNAAGTYTLTVTAPNNCFAAEATTVSLNITVPDANASVTGVLTCLVTMVTIQGSSSTPGVTYSWEGPGCVCIEQNETITLNGNYVLTVTDPTNGCSATDEVEVLQDVDLPGATAQGGTLTCDVTCLNLQGTGNGTFAWTGPNGFTSDLQNPEVCAPGTYVLTVTGENGCTSTANAIVDQDVELPGATAQGGTLTCEVTCLDLSGNGNGDFAWTGPNGFESSEQNPEVCAPGTYVLTVTGSNGCTSTANAIVGQEPCDECPPMIIFCGPNVTIECGDSDHPYDVGHPEFRKDEDCPEVYVSWTDQWFGTCPYTLERYWVAWDDFGNVEYCTQTITVIDTQPPVIHNVPADITVDCHNVPEASGEVWAADACKEWYYVYVTDKIEEGDCPHSYVIQRVYWAVDECDNYGYAVQTIHVMDQLAPVLYGVPEDVTVACDAVPEPANVWAEDLCDPNVMVYFEESTYPGSCVGNYQLVRMWSATDACGNPAAMAQLITVVDEEPPVILCDLSDMTVHCKDVPEPPDCLVEDNCDDGATLTMTEDKTGDGCKKPYVITWTWTATDDCGNNTVVVQTINVINKQWPFATKNDPTSTSTLMVQVAPNPFRDQSMIKFDAPEEGMASVEIFDLAGRSVAQIYNAPVSKGQEVRAIFTPVENGSGTYLYRVTLNDLQEHGRLIHQP